MGRAVLQACVPWMALLVVSLAAAYLLARLSRARLCLGRLRELHRDQVGAVQSLSFVLTLPFFVMIMLFILQVSQLIIGTIVVHYAAYAAARSAVVWIPADLGHPEGSNCISHYSPDPKATEQVFPVVDAQSPSYGPSQGGVSYVVQPGSPKFQKIASAAVLACVPISPSRDTGFALSGPGPAAAAILKAAYGAMVNQSGLNAAIPKRIEHKLAYALNNTQVEIRFFHKNVEPPLVTYLIEDDLGEFYFNEIGWQDPITVTVTHDLALLPGPGRLLARKVLSPGGAPDQVSQTVQKKGKVHVYPLTASATMGNEGEKPVLPYVYQVY